MREVDTIVVSVAPPAVGAAAGPAVANAHLIPDRHTRAVHTDERAVHLCIRAAVRTVRSDVGQLVALFFEHDEIVEGLVARHPVPVKRAVNEEEGVGDLPAAIKNSTTVPSGWLGICPPYTLSRASASPCPPSSNIIATSKLSASESADFVQSPGMGASTL